MGGEAGDRNSKKALCRYCIKSSLLFWQVSMAVQKQMEGPACLIDRVTLVLNQSFRRNETVVQEQT